MCDVFEPRDDVDDSREGLWALIGETPNLTWQLLTKRPGRVEAMVPERWREESARERLAGRHDRGPEASGRATGRLTRLAERSLHYDDVRQLRTGARGGRLHPLDKGWTGSLSAARADRRRGRSI